MDFDEIEASTAQLSVYSNTLFVLGSFMYVVIGSASVNGSPVTDFGNALVLHGNVVAALLFIFNGLLDSFVAYFQPVGPAGNAHPSEAEDLHGHGKRRPRRTKPHLGFLLGGILFVLGSALYAWNALVVWFAWPRTVDPWTLFWVDIAASHTFLLDSAVYLMAGAASDPAPPRGCLASVRIWDADFWGDVLFAVGSALYALDSYFCAPFSSLGEDYCQPVNFLAAWVFMIDSLLYSYAKYKEGLAEASAPPVPAALGPAIPLPTSSSGLYAERRSDENAGLLERVPHSGTAAGRSSSDGEEDP